MRRTSGDAVNDRFSNRVVSDHPVEHSVFRQPFHPDAVKFRRDAKRIEFIVFMQQQARRRAKSCRRLIRPVCRK